MRFIVLIAAVLAAALYVVGFGLGEGKPGQLAYDVFGYYYPNVLYALRALESQNSGLLWNPFQNCGQPFFGITESGLLYPLNALFLVFHPQLALRVLLVVNLLIGGLGSYALARQLGTGVAAAIGAALAFVLGGPAFHMTNWMPTVQAPYVWMPVAMLCCERLMRAPSLSGGLLLGLSLAAGLLPGHPQFVLFTCQLVALRLLWALFDRGERRQFGAAFAYVALAMIVMLLLTAAQFVPSLEVIRESIRGAALSPDEIAPRGINTLAEIARMVLRHEALAPFTAIPAFLAIAAFSDSRHRRSAVFYGLAGLIFFLLSFGDKTILGEIYYDLPVSSLFRQPLRFRFVTGFCVSVLIGLSIDALARGSWRAVAVAALTLAGLYAWLGHLWPIDWQIAAVILGAAALAAVLPAGRAVAAAVMVAAIGAGAVLHPHWTVTRFLPDDAPYMLHKPLFERLHQRLTPQDRVHLALPTTHDASFLDKTAMLFQLRATTDYELQLSQRYAEYVTMLRRNELMNNVNAIHFPGPWNPRMVVWPLVNLAAARYLVLDKAFEKELDPDDRLPLTFVDGDERISIYENGEVLPRAYYVPQIVVEPDRAQRLLQLGRGGGDRRLQAIVNQAPASGFVGVAGNQRTADARFVVDDAEHVTLELVAPERGFLFLADQYFPGWIATVNGEPASILIANHTFRAVEVPSGPVTVDFRYQPRSIWIGAAISAVTAIAVVALLVAGWLRRPRPVPRPIEAEPAPI